MTWYGRDDGRAIIGKTVHGLISNIWAPSRGMALHSKAHLFIRLVFNDQASEIYYYVDILL